MDRKKGHAEFGYSPEVLNDYKEALAELGKEKYAELLALYKKSQLNKRFGFIKFYKAYADEMMDGQKGARQ